MNRTSLFHPLYKTVMQRVPNREAFQPRVPILHRGWVLVWALVLVGTSAPVQAQDLPCQAQLEQRYSDASADLALVLEQLPQDKRGPVLGWADCNAPHYNLGRVVEEAVRALDQSRRAEENITLFLSAAQTVRVSNPKGAFPRSMLVPRVTSRPARAILESRLQPPLGDLAWAAILADLNAETHSLRAWTALKRADLLGKDTADLKPRDELAASMLMVVTYLDFAQRERPPVFTSLASEPAAVDALGLLWTRAEAALQASQTDKLGKEDTAVLTAVYAKLPTLKELFVRSGRPVPTFAPGLAQKAAPTGAQADNQPTKDNSKAESGAENQEPDPKSNNTKPAASKTDQASAQANAGDGTKDNAAQDPPKGKDNGASGDKAAETKAETKDKATAKDDKNASDDKADTVKNDDKSKADDGSKAEDKNPKDKADSKGKDEGDAVTAMPWEGTVGIVRMSLLGVGLLLPWLLLLVLYVRKRREKPYIQLANQLVTFATVFVILEALAVLMVNFAGALNVFWSFDGVFLFIPIYTFVILLVMLRRLDPEGKIAARKVVRNWAIGGAVTLVVLLIGNMIVPFAVPQAFGIFAIPVSFIILGLMACGFLLHLWVVSSREEAKGDNTDDAEDTSSEDAQEASSDGSGDDPKPEGDAKEESTAAPSAATTPTPTESPAPEVATTPEPADLGSLGDDEDMALGHDVPAGDGGGGDGDSAYEGMSDEEFAAAFAALDGGGGDDDGGGEAPDDDRSELYKLLGDS